MPRIPHLRHARLHHHPEQTSYIPAFLVPSISAGEDPLVDYSLSEEQQSFRGDLRDYCETVIAPLTSQLEHAQPMPRDIIEGIQFKLAEGYVKIEALRHLTQHALWSFDQERLGRKERFEVSLAAAMSKSVATDWSFEVINSVMQWQGAFGYLKLCPDQKALRGVRSFSLAEGTAEIMKLIISQRFPLYPLHVPPHLHPIPSRFSFSDTRSRPS